MYKKITVDEYIIEHATEWSRRHYEEMSWREISKGGCTEKMSLAGEIAENYIRTLYGLGLKPDSNGPDGGVDLIINGHTIDVKCTSFQRGSEPHEWWDSNISAHQIHYKPDYYIFCSYNISKKALWILGGISSTKFLEKAKLIPEGTKRSTGFIARNDMYSITNRHLNPLQITL